VLAEPLVDEFVIVDNGSPADEAERCARWAATEPRVVLQQGHGNIGFARGANLGAETARGEYIVFLNPDANLQDGCIEALVSAFEGQPVPTVVGARVMNTDGTEQRGGRRGEVTPVTTLLSFGHLTARFKGWRKFEIHREHEPCPTAGADADHLRRLLRPASRGLRTPGRLRRGLFPARRGHRPVLARPPGRRPGAVPARPPR
jgi:N-acetylglucosaminyl-diphospho-decaprenol L-rhamnosyltransferase